MRGQRPCNTPILNFAPVVLRKRPFYRRSRIPLVNSGQASGEEGQVCRVGLPVRGAYAMTLHPTTVTPVPAETVRVARAAVPKGNVYIHMRDVLGAIYSDEQFADLFASRGRPVV